MSVLYWSEEVNGESNAVVYGNGLLSTDVEPKIIKRVWVRVSARAGNFIEFWVERERIAVIHDTYGRLNNENLDIVFEFNREIEPGRVFRPAIRCGATPTSVVIMYEYEVKG